MSEVTKRNIGLLCIGGICGLLLANLPHYWARYLSEFGIDLTLQSVTIDESVLRAAREANRYLPKKIDKYTDLIEIQARGSSITYVMILRELKDVPDSVREDAWSRNCQGKLGEIIRQGGSVKREWWSPPPSSEIIYSITQVSC